MPLGGYDGVLTQFERGFLLKFSVPDAMLNRFPPATLYGVAVENAFMNPNVYDHYHVSTLREAMQKRMRGDIDWRVTS